MLLVEPFALDARADNLASNPMAALLYTATGFAHRGGYKASRSLR